MCKACGKAAKQWMHADEQMELRNCKSQIPLSDRNPILPEKKKGAGFGLCFPMLCINETKEISLLGS